MDKKYTIDDLLEILRVLRGENGCPWDRVQTHDSIKKNMIEETYEAIDALESGDDKAFANELGDVLLQVAFHSEIARERNAFDFGDVLNELCTKLIARHTHVFGEDKARSAEDALVTWEMNKKKEYGIKTDAELLKEVPHGLPALMRAQKVQKKAEACGFDFSACGELFKSACEKMNEISEGTEQSTAEKTVGEMLFAAALLARRYKVDAETALAASTNSFIKSFEKGEKREKDV